MGSGKSIIGKDLSKLYNIEFFDSDLIIEKKVGKTINQIFRDFGEKFFREIEEEIFFNLLDKNNCVISLGGGSITNFKIREFIDKNSLSIYLKVNNNILLDRLRSSKKRPLLNKNNKKDIINNLLSEREIFYNNSDLVIDNNYGKKETIKKIKLELNGI